MAKEDFSSDKKINSTDPQTSKINTTKDKAKLAGNLSPDKTNEEIEKAIWKALESGKFNTVNWIFD